MLILPRGRPRPQREASLTIFPRQTQQQAYSHHAERPARARHHQPPMYRESPLATAQQPVLTPAEEWRQRYAYSRYGGAAARTLVSPPPRMDVGHDTVLDVAIPVDLDADAETTSRLLRRAGFLRPAYLHLLSALLLFAGLDCLLLASGVLPLYATIAVSLASALALLAWCVTRPRPRADGPSESIRESIRESFRETLESLIEIPDTEELETLPGPGEREAVDPDLDGEDPEEEEIAVPAASAEEDEEEDDDDASDERDEDDNRRPDNVDSDHVPVEDIDLDRIATIGATSELERCPRDLGRR